MLLVKTLRDAHRLRQIKRKIRRVGTGEYKPGNSSKPGHLYNPVPFEAFADVPSQREACAERFEMMARALPDGLAPGRLLDIGCNIGFNSFKFAERGFRCVGLDVDPLTVEIASDVAKLYGVSAEFWCAEVSRAVIEDLGRFDVALFLSCFQWVTLARGFDFARDVLRAAQERSTVMFFETSMGAEGRAKMPMLPDVHAVERLLADVGLHDEILCLGEVPAPNVWLQKSRYVFRTRRTE